MWASSMTIFSKVVVDHPKHFKKVFKKCKWLGISLDQKKSFFGMTKGRMLVHIMSKKEVKIDPERVEAIKTLPLPIHKKII